MCLDRFQHGDVIPVVKSYKDFLVGVKSDKYVLRPVYYNKSMVYDDINKLYTHNNAGTMIRAWTGGEYPTGYHGYASRDVGAMAGCIRCTVWLYQVHTLGVQNGEIVLVADQFQFVSSRPSVGYMHDLVCYVENDIPHTIDAEKFEADMGIQIKLIDR